MAIDEKASSANTHNNQSTKSINSTTTNNQDTHPINKQEP